MKRKMLMLLMPVFAFLIGSNFVSATSLDISITCNDTTVGSMTTCTVMGTTDGEINGIHGEYAISDGATFSSFTPGSGWLGEGNNGSFDLYTDMWKQQTFPIGTFYLQTNRTGEITVTISGIFGSDENFNRVNATDVNTTFTVR